MAIASKQALRAPRFLRGSVVVNRRRCGKPTCRCATGTVFHETTVLSYSEAGRTKFVALAPDQVAPVKAAVERYRLARAALEHRANVALAELVASRPPRPR